MPLGLTLLLWLMHSRNTSQETEACYANPENILIRVIEINLSELEPSYQWSFHTRPRHSYFKDEGSTC